MLRNVFKIVFLGLVFMLSWSKSIASLIEPSTPMYPNPYKLMDIDDYEKKEYGAKWVVYANQNQALLLAEPKESASETGKTNFLERFIVEEKKQGYLKVKSQDRNWINGWIDMKAVVILKKSIRNPSNIPYKAFLQVRVDEKITEEGKNILRFRDGPGIVGDYKILGEQVSAGDVFMYIYGIYFKPLKPNKNKSENDCQDEIKKYLNSSCIDKADYYLVGTKSSYSRGEYKETILGWLPRASTVLWLTRQALEPIPNNPIQEAHIFDKESDLKAYFNKDKSERQNFLNQHKEEIILDTNRIPKTGQELRYILLSTEKRIYPYNKPKIEAITYHNIGYTGHDDGGNNKRNQELADIQKGTEFLEIFFLIDGTKSMSPAIKAAAQVIKDIKTFLIGELYLTVNFQAAVYRDQTRDCPIIKYEEWRREGQQSIEDWLINVKTIHECLKYDNFHEALFDGIESGLSRWERNSIHKYSTKVMIIMGDVGDKLAELNNNAEYMLNENATKIFKKLEEQAVIPIAIHFKHKSTISKMYLHDKHRNEYTYETERRRNGEKQAWQNFKAHLNLIKPEHPFPLYTIGSTTRVESISTLTDNIKPVLTRIVTQISKLSKEMPKISLGQQAIKDLVCKKAFPKQSDLEVQCKQQSDWDKLTNFFEKHSSSNKNVGITISKFDALIKKNPELEAIIMTNPEIAFANGFIAVREKGEAITRPVLLLAFIEIKRITSEIDNITNFYRDCSVTQSIIHYKRVMATILGELLNINPDNVKEKEAKKWFGLVVDSKHSTLNSTNLIKRLCLKDENGKSPKWNNFLKRLETASRTLKDIVKKESKKRQFLDLQGYHYYWIYPEEILPSIPK